MSEQDQTDVHKDEENRRKIRSDYMSLIDETEESKIDCVKPGNEQISSLLSKGNKLFQEITHAREGALDSAWFRLIGTYSVEQIQQTHIGKTFDPDDLIKKLEKKYKTKDDPFDLKTLGNDVGKYFLRTPSVTFMNGPIKNEPKQKKEREKKKRTKLTQENAEKPEEIKKDDDTKEEETTKKVKQLFKSLKDKKDSTPTLRDSIIDEKSFTKTIENIFHLGFLVKEGRIGLEKKDGDLNCVLKEDEEETVLSKQSVLKIDLDKWNSLKRKRE